MPELQNHSSFLQYIPIGSKEYRIRKKVDEREGGRIAVRRKEREREESGGGEEEREKRAPLPHCHHPLSPLQSDLVPPSHSEELAEVPETQRMSLIFPLEYHRQ